MKGDNKNCKPIPSVDWNITDICNYRCEYCCQKQYNIIMPRYGHANDKTIDKVLKVLSDLPGSWRVKLIGGEALIHPRFLEICDEILKLGHTICLITNFSVPFEKLKRFVEVCGDKLDFVVASLHVSQINIDDFIKKAIWFNSIKNPRTGFTVTSVAIEYNFLQLKKIKEKLGKEGISFKFQRLLHDGKFIQYPEHIEKYIAGCLSRNTETIQNKSFFGTKCHTGELFFIIKPNGDAYRCFETQPGMYLGNIAEGTFKRNSGPLPCLSFKCQCTVAANRNMILFDEKENPFKLALYLGKTLNRDRDFIKKVTLKKALNEVKHLRK